MIIARVEGKCDIKLMLISIYVLARAIMGQSQGILGHWQGYVNFTQVIFRDCN